MVSLDTGRIILIECTPLSVMFLFWCVSQNPHVLLRVCGKWVKEEVFNYAIIGTSNLK